jgi:hypothetical protein
VNFVRAAACLLLLMSASATARAHDSWLVQDAPGQWFLHTGPRYPDAEGPGRRAPVTCGNGSCWVQTGEAEVALEPDLVTVYLREARPPSAIERRWERLRARGVGWQERYSKFARVDMPAPGPRTVAGAALEIVAEGTALRVLAHGRPLAGQSVEVVSEDGTMATWTSSDANGRIVFHPAAGGRYLARAIRIEPDGLRWRSHFATLGFTQPGRASASARGR